MRSLAGRNTAKVRVDDSRYVLNTSLAAEQIRTADAVAMRPWFAAVGNRDNASARLLILGDSRVEGEGTSVALTNRAQARTSAALRRAFPTSGLSDGQEPPNNYYPVRYVSPSLSGLGPWTTTGTITASNNFGLGTRVCQLAVGATATLTVTATTVKLAYVRTNGVSTATQFRWRVDGGSWTTVNAGGGLLDGQLVTISGLSAGSHTIDVECLTGTTYLAGAYVFNGDESKGIHIYDAGHHGLNTGSTQFTGANLSTYLPACVANVDPHCVLINLGTNDHGTNVAPATFKTNLNAIIAAVEGACTLPPTIVLMVEAGRADGSFTYNWSDYVTKMREAVAESSRRTLLDLSLRMPSLADNSLSIWADGLHENNKGQALKALAMSSFLSPR